MVEQYYTFDDLVLREFIGKKLRAKEFESLSQRTRVPVLGCRRISDNLKRVTKRLEDAVGDVTILIQDEFFLGIELASQYAVVAFINTVILFHSS